MSARFQSENSCYNTTRRLVRVFVTDPDDKLPLANCVLYQGMETLTEATDTELFLELGIPALLEKHNAIRKSLDLPEIKPRALRMVVATLMYV